MFGYKKRTMPYTTPGNPSKGHGATHRVLDDGSIYAYCSCGWSATGRNDARGDARYEALNLLDSHVTNSTSW